MKPEEFREARLKINGLCKQVEKAADQKDPESAQELLEQAKTKLETLFPQAEGEIQERSVRNLKLKIKNAKLISEKIKAPKSGGKGKTTEYVNWDEDAVAGLSGLFLEKLLTNMGSNPETTVCFSKTGKGVKPSYQVYPPGNDPIPFSGSSHKPLKRRLPETQEKISPAFSRAFIQSVLK